MKIRSALNGKFVEGDFIRDIDYEGHFKLQENSETNFTLLPHGKQLEWRNVFGDILGLGQFEHLSKFALPFYLLAMHEERKCYYVNAHEVVSDSHDDHHHLHPTVLSQEYPNTFTLIGGDHSTGTGYLLYAGNGKFLSVIHRMHHSCFGKCETLSSSSLKISSANGAPDSHFLFDFVPRSVGTFAIRSQENGKFVRYVKCLDDGDGFAFNATELEDNFPIDAECAEAGTEFITLPIEIDEISDARIKFYCFYFLLKSPPLPSRWGTCSKTHCDKIEFNKRKSALNIKIVAYRHIRIAFSRFSDRSNFLIFFFVKILRFFDFFTRLRCAILFIRLKF